MVAEKWFQTCHDEQTDGQTNFFPTDFSQFLDFRFVPFAKRNIAKQQGCQIPEQVRDRDRDRDSKQFGIGIGQSRTFSVVRDRDEQN